jgi:ABC-type multidrug transport system fused ATPase/permease subunit
MLKTLKDRTVIVIAHRLQTIRNVDRIFILEEGRLAENGTFEELLQKDGLFRRLWEKQSAA